jgi:hypothetical protein
MWRHGVRRGRAGQVFQFSEPGVLDRATAISLAADRRGPLQDDQTAKSNPAAARCLRILDQGLGTTRARSASNWPLEPPAPGLGGLGSRVGWTSLSLTPKAAHFRGNPRSGRGRAALGHALAESESLPLIR